MPGRFIFIRACELCLLRCKKHRDQGNVGPSYIIGFGEYEGGELVVWNDQAATAGRPQQAQAPSSWAAASHAAAAEVYSVKHRFVRFNGKTQWHETAAFQGVLKPAPSSSTAASAMVSSCCTGDAKRPQADAGIGGGGAKAPSIVPVLVRAPAERFTCVFYSAGPDGKWAVPHPLATPNGGVTTGASGGGSGRGISGSGSGSDNGSSMDSGGGGSGGSSGGSHSAFRGRFAPPSTAAAPGTRHPRPPPSGAPPPSAPPLSNSAQATVLPPPLQPRRALTAAQQEAVAADPHQPLAILAGGGCRGTHTQNEINGMCVSCYRGSAPFVHGVEMATLNAMLMSSCKHKLLHTATPCPSSIQRAAERRSRSWRAWQRWWPRRAATRASASSSPSRERCAHTSAFVSDASIGQQFMECAFDRYPVPIFN